MKTIITALVAMTIQFTAVANPVDNIKKPVSIEISVPTISTKDQTKATIIKQKEENISKLNYMIIMQNSLSILEKQKYELAIENLEAENSFNQLMNNMHSVIEENKMKDQIQDLEAWDRYSKLMNSAISI